MPAVYAQIFERLLPDLMAKSNTGFRVDRKYDYNRLAFFVGLSEADVARIHGFLLRFEQLIVVGLNKNIDSHFSDEMEFCMALDWVMPKPGENRTLIGELRYRAKFRNDSRAAVKLVAPLVEAVELLPFRGDDSEIVLTCPPVVRGNARDLPTRLVTAVADELQKEGRRNRIISATLKMPKPAIKDLSIEQKLDFWRRTVEAESIELSGPVTGSSVCIIDDLYKSGCTMWSYAKFLKVRGASEVLGLVCVKALGDRDGK
jgi:hypothetical protein